jgi:NADH dehydrogenase [ubiquinone] 1 alpha subcomplex assembly factor 3
LSDNGIRLADGLLIPGACIFLEGKVYLWDTPELNTNTRTTQEIWRAWGEEHFQIFDLVAPRPGGSPCSNLILYFSMFISIAGF